MSDNKERITVFLDEESRKKVDDFKAEFSEAWNFPINDSKAVNALIRRHSEAIAAERKRVG